MSQEKVEIAKRVFDAINKRDWGALSEIVDPALEFQSIFSGMEGRTFRGATGVAEVFEEIDATWADVTYEVEGVRNAGERSVVLFQVVGTARGSGIPLDERLAQIWTWRSGRPYRVETLTDRRKALEAVGLSE